MVSRVDARAPCCSVVRCSLSREWAVKVSHAFSVLQKVVSSQITAISHLTKQALEPTHRSLT